MKKLRCSAARRPLSIETLETKVLLAADVGIVDWHNESNSSDVDGDGYATPQDALRVINLMARSSANEIRNIQQDLCDENTDAEELAGGFFPDATNDGNLSAQDAIVIVNRLINQRSDDPLAGTVAVMPDSTGRPMSIVFSAIDGRTKEIDLSEYALPTVTWNNGAASVSDLLSPSLVSDPVTNSIRIIAKPNEGILQVRDVGIEREAVVTRFLADGGEQVERYVCIPLIPVDFDWGQSFEITDLVEDELRVPIEGFEEAIGAMVSRETTDGDGMMVVEEYVEDVSDMLLRQMSVSIPEGSTLTVGGPGVATLAGTTPDSEYVANQKQMMVDVMRSGYVPETSDPITAGQLRILHESLELGD